LIHSRAKYKLETLHKYAALYRGPGGYVYGFAVEANRADDSKGKLTVFFGAKTPRADRELFLRHLNRELEQLALVGSVVRERIYYCGNCQSMIDPGTVRLRITRGKLDVICPICEKRYLIDDLAEQSAVEDDHVRFIADRAEEEKGRQVRLTTRAERERAGKFDVFLSYNQDDKPIVWALAQKLRDEGVAVALDEEVIRPGDPLPAALERIIHGIRVLAVCIGPQGLGDWQEREYHLALSKYIEDRDEAGRSSLRLVPVLLPEMQQSHMPPLLSGFDFVDFREGIDDDPYRKLVRAIVRYVPRF
jgi:RNase P subunit RPR2